jgi:NADPH:quinone reductase-like Zn-dependent oxidoreductase
VKAMVHTEYGTPEVLRLEDVEQPVPDKDEVLIRVRAAGVNWADHALLTGVPWMVRLGSGIRRPRNGIRGTDVAGVVEAVGADVTRFGLGDGVLGWCKGAFAEYVCAPEADLVSKPENIAFEQAAAVPMAGMVALQALRDIGDVQAGEKVLIVGASGGIGSFAVQIAKAMGAEVTGVSSTPNADLVRSIGADHVIDYTKADFTEGSERYDFILDMSDTHSLAERRRVMTPDGVLIPNSGRGGRWAGSLRRIVAARLFSPFVSQTLRPFLSMPKRDDLLELTELIASGDVTPVVGRTHPLAGVGDAMTEVASGHARGKTVIVV